MKNNKIVEKIKHSNLELLDEEEKSNEYILNKLYHWQEDYDYVSWEEFRDTWVYCDRCKGYDQGGCICYAR